MRRVDQLIWPVVLLFGGAWLAGCQQTGEALTSRKERENAEEIQQYVVANNLQATQIGNTGAFFTRLVSAPTSQSAGIGDEVRFFVTSRRFDGMVIDSTDGVRPVVYAYGSQPNRVNTLQNGSYLYTNITNGMFLGLTVAREGERIAVLVPSSLDAGRVGTLVLPQYSPIRYDMRILSIKTEDKQIEEYIAANKISVTKKLDNGIRIATTLARPDSALITPGQSVTVNYTGRFMDGTRFDSRADSSYNFVIGKNQAVPGFDLGLQQARRGEKLFLVFPSALGYGATGRGSIGPYKPLAFELAIVRVK